MSVKVMSGAHERKCWDCGNVAVHMKSITPEVLCTQCGSQDTRRVKGEKPSIKFKVADAIDDERFISLHRHASGTWTLRLKNTDGTVAAMGDKDLERLLMTFNTLVKLESKSP